MKLSPFLRNLMFLLLFLSTWQTQKLYAFQSLSDYKHKQIHQDQSPVSSLIVKYKTNLIKKGELQRLNSSKMHQLIDLAGIELRYSRPMSGTAHVINLLRKMTINEAKEICATISLSPEIEYAEPDYILSPAAIPNDIRYSEQWNLTAPTSNYFGINAQKAWNTTRGSSDVYIAVLDTGSLNHADLAGRWIGGYDMISDPARARDGDSRDSDPTDAGDWFAEDECLPGKGPRESSWHGTQMAGIISAVSNNNLGISGINWESKIVPVRVLGKCGGSLSDVVDGIRWAAGLPVAGVPNNPYPAKVINLSIDHYSENGCRDVVTLQDAINDAYGVNASIITASGNYGSDASSNQIFPASCNNVITVAAMGANGDNALYSSNGTVVDLSAPGGHSDPIVKNRILTLYNNGVTSPTTDSYEFKVGTSHACAHVTGVASLLYSINPSFKPSEIRSLLVENITAFNTRSGCNLFPICGSGIVNAADAVEAALAPPPPTPPIKLTVPFNLLLDGQ